MIQNCVKAVVSNNSGLPIHDNDCLTNLILENDSFPNKPFSRKEIEEFLMDPLNSKTVVEMANEQLRPSTNKSSFFKKTRLHLEQKNPLPVSIGPNSDFDIDQSPERSASSIKKSKLTFTQKAFHQRKGSQQSSPSKDTKYIFSPTSASAFNSENQQTLSRTVTRMG